MAQAAPATILVADDDELILQLITFQLEDLGHTVVSASNGEEAVQRARESKPDMAILDIRMPRMTGFEAAREIRSGGELAGLPIVFLTAQVEDSSVTEGRELASAYMTKPFDSASLAATIDSILGDDSQQSAA